MSDTSVQTRKTIAGKAYDELFAGVKSVDLLDVPDYPNVGDSAIFLGLMNYFESRGIQVRVATSIDTLNHDSVKESKAVALMGGGSFGGLYPVSDEHRVFIMSQLPKNSLFIQCPQSVHFVSDEIAVSIARSIKLLGNRRIAVRDESSKQKLAELGVDSVLMPDSSVFLESNDLNYPSSSKRGESVVYLIRGDKEGTHHVSSSIDNRWLRDRGALRLSSKVRKVGRYFSFLARALNPSPSRWRRIAKKRLVRGMNLIGGAEIVVTDRLHGMLLALQIGKKVVALDNSNHKLSGYAKAWLGNEPNLTFVKNLQEANYLTQRASQEKVR